MRGNPQALFGKRPTEKDPAKGTSPAVDFTRPGGRWKRTRHGHLASGLPEPIHSNSARPGGTITIHTTIGHGERVRIEIHDDGGPWDQPAVDVDRPHGLDLVSALATQWGITGTTAGRTVWAQLDWPTP